MGFEEAVDVLQPLLDAGWFLDEQNLWADADVIFGSLCRACSAMDFEFDPSERRLTLLASEDPDAMVVLLDEPLVIGLGGGDRSVEALAGASGLLDPCQVEPAPECEMRASEFTAVLFVDEVLERAAEYRGTSMREAAEALDQHPEFSGMMRWIMFTGGSRVLPEYVPSAVALAIGGFCWRNNTSVEDEHHRVTDVEMAKTNIAAVRVAQRHVTDDGVDWAGLEDALCAPGRELGDGRRIDLLFGESWVGVADSVRSQVRLWRRFDDDLLGPDATLILLSIAGASGYMRHWWGQGRWPSIVETVTRQLASAGVAPPPPYDELGVERLVRDLSDAPDRVPDEVLGWAIDPPVPLDGPRGLRMTDATSPIIRKFFAATAP
ncbi:hypothetical protein [Kribbella kalugense]|uniref:Uncharacterized protein n=1 Tax=Kribbella kalugense TaxID=2512221 RepID=A0A4R7ZTU5_9ACTN|nr:hypothetical protein [Kribbella kalugense]TDW18950.1 hypothetical protein EV650_5553 [Kribbella kalugense]